MYAIRSWQRNIKTVEELYQKYREGKLKSKEVPLILMYGMEGMEWNKRSSGNKYDSISGHGFVLGGNSTK